MRFISCASQLDPWRADCLGRVCEHLLKRKTWVIVCAVLIALSSIATAFSVDSAPSARVVFKAGEPDVNGVFTVDLIVHNATFNAFQFALAYSKDVIAPSTRTGAAASSFSECAQRAEGTSSWMETIGNKLDTDRGLLECGGYVKPGSGSVTAGSSGMALYSFTFKKIGSGSAKIYLATQAAGGPYNPSIKEGGGLAEAGYNVDARIEIQLPKSLGESVTTEIVSPQTPSSPSQPEAPVDARSARVSGTVILQIDNRAAARDGNLMSIDKDNALVRPYIDASSRTMVPIRFLAESLGANVGWDPDTRRVTIEHGNRVIVMTIGAKSFTINGAARTMDTVPVINAGWSRTMVPLRFIGEALGMDVQWDSVNRLVILAPLSNPWDLNGDVEKQITPNILLMFSPLMKGFV